MTRERKDMIRVNKAILPSTATNSPPPQVKLVLLVAPGAVMLRAENFFLTYFDDEICVV